MKDLAKSLTDVAAVMRAERITSAQWTPAGILVAVTMAPAAPAQPAPIQRSAADLATMVAARKEAALKQQHETMFAASSIRPRLKIQEPAANVVPRAVRAKQADSGSRSKK